MTTNDLAITSNHATDNTAPYVAVGTDKATGRAIVALDAAAVDALTSILDDLVNSDRFMYPDSGISPDGAARQSAVAHAIYRPLLKLQGFIS